MTPYRRPTAGCPPLAANVWLEEQVGAHPILRERQSPGACPQVYEQWLLRHELERGWKLAEPRRSYRRALRTILDREERSARRLRGRMNPGETSKERMRG